MDGVGENEALLPVLFERSVELGGLERRIHEEQRRHPSVFACAKRLSSLGSSSRSAGRRQRWLRTASPTATSPSATFYLAVGSIRNTALLASLLGVDLLAGIENGMVE